MARKPNPLVTPVTSLQKRDRVPAKLGGDILGGKKALVKYRRKHWLLSELLEHLARKVIELERKQCVPRARCLFKYYDYIDDAAKRTGKKIHNDTSDIRD